MIAGALAARGGAAPRVNAIECRGIARDQRYWRSMAKAAEIPGLDAQHDATREAAARTVAVRGEEVFEHCGGRARHRRHRARPRDARRDAAPARRARDLRAVLRARRAAPRPARRQGSSPTRSARAATPTSSCSRSSSSRPRSGPTSAPGVELFIERTRAEQSEGNRPLADALAQAERSDLRARIARLAASARAAPTAPAARARAARDAPTTEAGRRAPARTAPPRDAAPSGRDPRRDAAGADARRRAGRAVRAARRRRSRAAANGGWS